VAVPLSYWKEFEVERIIPEPVESQVNRDSLFYFFKGVDKGTIQFYLSPETRGRLEGALLVNNAQFPISHFIYP
jgi:hypothetical protein